jgi:peptidoglycan biosynthesis protein MviN/MurJ (putative lipid II flippase)
VVATWTLVSRATGLARVVVAGAVLGPTFLANILLSTNVVPNLVYTTVAGPVLGMVVVPAVVRALATDGPEQALRLLSRITGYLLAIAGVVLVALLIASPGLAWVLTAGMPAGAGHRRGLVLTLLVLVLVAPQVVLYTLAGVGVAAQQVQGRFALAAAAPALENVGLIATLGVVVLTQSTDVDTGTVPLSLVITFGAGSTLAVALHAGAQLWGASRSGMPVRPKLRGWKSDPLAAETAKRIRASLPVAANPAIAYFGRLAVAATVPGGVFVLQAAYSIYNVPSAIGAKAVSSASLPGLSRAAAAHDRPGYAAAWRDSAGYVSLVGLPAMALMIAFARPVAEVLSAGKLQSAAIVASFAASVAVLGAAQLAAGAHEITRQALFARIEVDAPRRASMVYLVVTVVTAGGALLLPAGQPRLVALSATVLLSDLSAAVVVAARLRAVIAPERFLDRRRQLVAVVATVAMLPALVVGALLADGSKAGVFALVAMVAAAGGVALACYLAVLRGGMRRPGPAAPAVGPVGAMGLDGPCGPSRSDAGGASGAGGVGKSDGAERSAGAPRDRRRSDDAARRGA